MNSLYVAWHTREPTHQWGPVGRLDFDNGIYRFQYTHGATSLQNFQPFDGRPDLEESYESQELFPLFKNRLLPESRPEFRQYLSWSGFDPDDPPEPLVILAVTEGVKQTDAVEVFPKPKPDSRGCFVNFFFAHGVRHYMPNAGEAIRDLRSGDLLQIRPHPDNPVDANAMAIFAGEVMIGYIPRYLAGDVKQLVKECPTNEVRLAVQRVNQDAPMQQRLLCRLNACWPADFQPCQGKEFEPIRSDVVVG